VAWQPWKFDAAAHGGERGASASACRPADGAAAAQGAHGGGASAMPSRRSAQGPKAGGGAAVQAAAALLLPRGMCEGAGHGSKAAAGSALGSILRWWTANRRGSFLGRRERKKVPAMDELTGKRPEKGKRRGNSQTVMDSRKEGHYGVENDEIYLMVVTVFAGDV